MLERLLHELKPDRAYPQNPMVPQDNRLTNPPQRVRDHELVPQRLVQHLGVEPFSRDPQPAVLPVGSLWQLHA